MRGRRRKISLDRRGTDGSLVLDTGKVFVLVAMHLHRGQELRVIVFYRESEARSLVVLNHLRVVATVNSRGARHSTGPVIVCRDRKRPVAARVVVGAEQFGGGDGLAIRVQAIVMGARDLHVVLSGTTRELPDSNRARTRARTAVEARLDLREGHEFRRNSGRAERPPPRRPPVR